MIRNSSPFLVPISQTNSKSTDTGLTTPFSFIDNVPEGVWPLVQEELQAWVDRADFPVFGLTLPNGAHVDFCRRPWPPDDRAATVGAERDIDQRFMNEFLTKTKG